MRPVEPLVDPERLAGWMDAQGLDRGARLTVERITTGHSNEVFRVTRGDTVYVLRRPPRTPLSPTAHDMAREFRLLRAFHGRASAPVPRPIACCTDRDVIGVPFYLMAPIDGVVVREHLPAPLDADPASPRACAGALVDALAGIHAFDWAVSDLATFGKPDGYLDRQVPRWLGQLERYKSRELPEVDEAGRWLAAHTPAMQAPTVIHGDYKLDNVMFAPRLPVELVAVVDWEQSTIGDPLVDLGWMVGLWVEPGEEATLAGGSPFAAGADVPSRRELVERYARVTGRDVEHVAFYCVLGLFKLACVMEGSYARYRAGTSDDATFAHLAAGVPALARRALEFAAGEL
jgi:aminoglycoside phosphotransferase (APT) family kinase protein